MANDAEQKTDASKEVLSIVCVIHSLAGGGAERVMAGLASRLVAVGHRVTLVTFDDGTEDRHAISETVQRVFLKLPSNSVGIFRRFFRLRRRRRGIRRAVKVANASVVLSFCDRNNIDVLCSLGNRIAPIVVCERSDPSQQSLGFLRERTRKRTYHWAAAAIALTESSARYLREINDNVIVIPSAVGPPPLRSDRSAARRNRTVASVGRLEHEKGFDRLLTAFSIATESHTDWNLVIHGEGSQRQQLQDLANSLALSDRVQMPGWTRPIWNPLSEATLFCLPSRYEGFPSALLEAMALGVPSISVDCESGPRAIIRHGENGLLMDPSVEGLVEGIQRMMTDADERERLGEAGRTVIEDFGWDSMVTAFEDVLRDVSR